MRLWRQGFSPIGVDLGSRSLKLVQLSADGSALIEAVRWNRPEESPAASEDEWVQETVAGLRQALSKGRFHGRRAVFCVSAADLITQNVRVAEGGRESLSAWVAQECAGRLGIAPETGEIRYLDVGPVRQGETVRREVIVLATRRNTTERLVRVAEAAGLHLDGIEAEPMALLRCRLRQFRREEDRHQPMMFVNLGYRLTQIMIARDLQPAFLKGVPIAGKELDAAVCKNLQLRPEVGHGLRRNYGDRRASHRDPEVMRSVQQAIRPLLERLAGEIAMAVRYFSVTFRGEPPATVVLGGSEADELVRDYLRQQLHAAVELSDPLRAFEVRCRISRPLQWETALGLALTGCLKTASNGVRKEMSTRGRSAQAESFEESLEEQSLELGHTR